MAVVIVELGIPYTGWPMRVGTDYEFGTGIVSPDLARDLEEWARKFNVEFDEEKGWSSPALQAAHARSGQELRERVQQELGPNYCVVLSEDPA
ncbi:hypothetical protein [Microbacterium sp. NPDC055683]